MSIDSIRGTKAKRNSFRVVNIELDTYDRMTKLCNLLECSKRKFVDLAVNNLIKECDQRHLEIDKHYKERKTDE
jgi:hypothetical protein